MRWLDTATREEHWAYRSNVDTNSGRRCYDVIGFGGFCDFGVGGRYCGYYGNITVRYFTNGVVKLEDKLQINHPWFCIAYSV